MYLVPVINIEFVTTAMVGSTMIGQDHRSLHRPGQFPTMNRVAIGNRVQPE